MTPSSEMRDVPFMKNDMAEPTPTMGKCLDAADGPGRADTELGEGGEIPEVPAPTK